MKFPPACQPANGVAEPVKAQASSARSLPPSGTLISHTHSRALRTRIRGAIYCFLAACWLCYSWIPPGKRALTGSTALLVPLFHLPVCRERLHALPLPPAAPLLIFLEDERLGRGGSDGRWCCWVTAFIIGQLVANLRCVSSASHWRERCAHSAPCSHPALLLFPRLAGGGDIEILGEGRPVAVPSRDHWRARTEERRLMTRSSIPGTGQRLP